MTSLAALAHSWSVDLGDVASVTRRFPFRMSRYFAGLIRSSNDPIWRQVVPDRLELEDLSGWVDPLAEGTLSPVPHLVHRYDNRVLWLVSGQCAVACRFCTRKRLWGVPFSLSDEHLQAGLDYIHTHKEVRDVLLSGGDPLLLPISRLERIVASLRKIPHVEIIRIGTRVPGVLPRRVTPRLARMLAGYHPVFINLHFNHPWEITPESHRACATLAAAGIPLSSQTVLLRGVNDQASVLGELFQKLLTMRVRPYYLMQMDLTQGTAHFRTPIGTGLEILHALRNRISGLAMPHFVVDLPGGFGKVPLLPSRVEEITRSHLVLKNHEGRACEYPLLDGEDAALRRWLKE